METNLRLQKLACSYIHYKNHTATHLEVISKLLDKLNTVYDIIILMGDFNPEPDEIQMTVFFGIYKLKNLAKQKPCIEKTLKKPLCFDLILTNFPKYSHNTDVFETCLLLFHRLSLTMLKQWSIPS